MKIKTRPDDVGMLASDEWFQMNDWLAELRKIRRAESGDDGRDEPEDDDRSDSPDGRAGPRDGRSDPHDAGRAGPWYDGRAESRDSSQAGPPDAGRAGLPADGRGEPRGDGRARPRDEGDVALRDGRHGESRYDGGPGPHDAGRSGVRNDGRAQSAGHGYPPPETVAAAPLNRLFVRAATTARALIGNELRLPIAWCEMGPCISWHADPAALGEADIRDRAISAGWRVDAIGLLVCPQCQQTSPGFRSPLPVALWDRDQAIAAAGWIATEPSVDAVSIVAHELSHDLRRPAEDRGGEAVAASTWMPAPPSDDAVAASTWMLAAPSDDAVASAGEDRDESRRPAGDQHPESRSRSGRHRKRLVARLMLASH